MIHFGENLSGVPTGNRKKACELFHTNETHEYLEVKGSGGQVYWVTSVEGDRDYDFWPSTYFEL